MKTKTILVIALVLFAFNSCQKPEIAETNSDNEESSIALQNLPDNELIDILNQNPPLSSQELQDILFDNSPLSDDVLIAAVNRHPALNAEVIQNIVIINYPLSDNVLIAVLNSNPPLSPMDDAVIGKILTINLPLSTQVQTAFDNRTPPLDPSIIAPITDPTLVDPANPNNPSDSIGQLHNAGLDFTAGLLDETLVIDPATGAIDEVATAENVYNNTIQFATETPGGSPSSIPSINTLEDGLPSLFDRVRRDFTTTDFVFNQLEERGDIRARDILSFYFTSVFDNVNTNPETNAQGGQVYVEMTKAFENIINDSQTLTEQEKKILNRSLAVSKYSTVYWLTQIVDPASQWSTTAVGLGFGDDFPASCGWCAADVVGCLHCLPFSPWGCLGCAILLSVLKALDHC